MRKVAQEYIELVQKMQQLLSEAENVGGRVDYIWQNELTEEEKQDIRFRLSKKIEEKK